MNTRYFKSFLATMLAMTLLGCGQNISPKSDVKIVGGEEIADTKAPSVGLLFQSEGIVGTPFFKVEPCTGVRIRANAFLTTKDCLKPLFLHGGRLSSITTSKKESITDISVQGYLVHPDLNLGLFSLENIPEEINSTVLIASIENQYPTIDQDVWIHGSGCDQVDDSGACASSPTKYLKSLGTKVVAPPAGFDTVDPTYFFTSQSEGSIAGGDEGGPVFNDNGDLIGINDIPKLLGQDPQGAEDIKTHIWLGQNEASDFVNQAIGEGPTIQDPFLSKVDTKLYDIFLELRACGENPGEFELFDIYADRIHPDRTCGIKKQFPPDSLLESKAKVAKVRALYLAAGMLEIAFSEYSQGNIDSAEEAYQNGVDMLELAQQIGQFAVELTPLVDIYKCATKHDPFPDFEKISNLDWILSCGTATLDLTGGGFILRLASKAGRSKIVKKVIEKFVEWSDDIFKIDLILEKIRNQLDQVGPFIDDLFEDIAGVTPDLDDIDGVVDSAGRFDVPAGKIRKFAIDLANPPRRNHILNGEQLPNGSWSGGHLYPGKPTKTVFPESWSGDKIMHEASDIVTDPKVNWETLTGTGGDLTKKGKPARFKATAERDGVTIEVIVEPAGEGIITAFPKSGPGVIKNP